MYAVTPNGEGVAESLHLLETRISLNRLGVVEFNKIACLAEVLVLLYFLQAAVELEPTQVVAVPGALVVIDQAIFLAIFVPGGEQFVFVVLKLFGLNNLLEVSELCQFGRSFDIAVAAYVVAYLVKALRHLFGCQGFSLELRNMFHTYVG